MYEKTANFTLALKSYSLIGLIMLCISSCTEDEVKFKDYIVTGETYSETPISNLLYSQFIEIGFGYQIAPMSAELFFNRSFESFTPYNGKTKNSFGLLLPDNEYIRDWSGESWYHSGYRHDSWYILPGKADNPSIIDDDKSYFVTRSGETDATLEFVQDGGIHGSQHIRIINPGNEAAGIGQDGKYLEKGRKYHFTAYLRLISGTEKVSIELVAEGAEMNAVHTEEIEITGEFQKYAFEFEYAGENGWYSFRLKVPASTVIEADAFSMLPEDHFFGLKQETLEAVRRVNPGLVRFPGGCFASFYDWEKGTGPRDEREPEPSYFWGGMNMNDFGTAEYAMLCRETGAEMMICVNMYVPGKQYYLNKRNPWQGISYDLSGMVDEEEGILKSVEWLAYCNLEAGEHPMADLRAEHGYSEAFGVKYWEMDNEMVRWLSAEDYAALVVQYSEAMKEIDPSIKIGMVSYDYTDHLPEMLEIAGRHIDFLADRDDESLSRLDDIKDLVDEYNAQNNTHIKYTNTEWQVHPYGAKNPKEEVDERYLYGHKTEIKRAMVLGTWYAGLKAAAYLLEWQNYGEFVDFICFNNLSNTHGQAVFESAREGTTLTGPGMIFELISRTPARWPLKFQDYTPGRKDMIKVQAAWSMNKDTLVVFAVNRTDTAENMLIDLENLDADFAKADYSMLDADDIFSRNKADYPDEIRRKDWSTRIKKSRLDVQAPPRSFTHIVLSSD